MLPLLLCSVQHSQEMVSVLEYTLPCAKYELELGLLSLKTIPRFSLKQVILFVGNVKTTQPLNNPTLTLASTAKKEIAFLRHSFMIS